VKQRAEIEKQKNEITEIHKEVQDSINYAERIQKAVLPSRELINDAFSEHFILFKPKDVVSGDYYWAFKNDNFFVITVADCTGHGVPGAFMSMLGISFLNEIVKDTKILSASKILDELRQKIIFALKQKGIAGEQKDGMDMSLCVIDLDTNVLQWAGANNPLYIVSEYDITIMTEKTSYKVFEDDTLKVSQNKLFEIKPDKMPVAYYAKMDSFFNNVIQLRKTDQLYMFSDGYADQFGGPKGKKYKYKPFKRLILESCKKTMEEQKQILENSIEQWKAHVDESTKKTFEQIDDICIIGIKL
jgi:serine phosphatase RsbU (regulator of sigma subunit)